MTALWTAHEELKSSSVIVVEVRTDDGLTGYGQVMGHEASGIVESVGDGVTAWGVGDRVGVGWFGGCCERCDSCREELPGVNAVYGRYRKKGFVVLAPAVDAEGGGERSRGGSVFGQL